MLYLGDDWRTSLREVLIHIRKYLRFGQDLTRLITTIPSSRQRREGDLFLVRVHDAPPFMNVSIGTYTRT